MKHILLCADDYGQNIAISQAILALLEKKCLSATSCMTTSPQWMISAKGLKPFCAQADIGLHFNLTEGQPLSTGLAFFSLPQLLMNACLGRLDQAAIAAECHAQIDRFVAELGQLPDFLDGHQHIHHFPVVRDAVLAVYEQRLRATGAYIRCVEDRGALQRWGKGVYVKRLVIQFSGASAFKRQLIERKVPHNTSFAGIYDFTHAIHYKRIFPQFLSQIQDGGLIMCHPGLDYSEPDVIAMSRYHEYQYFCSDLFKEVCAAHGVVIKPKNKSQQPISPREKIC